MNYKFGYPMKTDLFNVKDIPNFWCLRIYVILKSGKYKFSLKSKSFIMITTTNFYLFKFFFTYFKKYSLILQMLQRLTPNNLYTHVFNIMGSHFVLLPTYNFSFTTNTCFKTMIQRAGFICSSACVSHYLSSSCKTIST